MLAGLSDVTNTCDFSNKNCRPQGPTKTGKRGFPFKKSKNVASEERERREGASEGEITRESYGPCPVVTNQVRDPLISEDDGFSRKVFSNPLFVTTLFKVSCCTMGWFLLDHIHWSWAVGTVSTHMGCMRLGAFIIPQPSCA